MNLLLLKINGHDSVRSSYMEKFKDDKKTAHSSFSQKQHQRSHPPVSHFANDKKGGRDKERKGGREKDRRREKRKERGSEGEREGEREREVVCSSVAFLCKMSHFCRFLGTKILRGH